MDPWSAGATALIPAPGTKVAELPGLMAAQDVTLFAAAPGIYRQILRARLPPLPHLRHGLSAGEKLSETIRDGWQAATGTALHEAFGMSECSTFVSGSPARPAPAGRLGFAQPGRRIAVLGPDGPVARGAAGILAVDRADPGLMLGYLGAEDATSARMQGHWFLTGDCVVMADDGALTYLGRGDDMMNAGGYRVSPTEVEAAMAAHPGVHEAACVEISVKQSDTVIACHYVPEVSPLDPAVLSAHAHARLAHYNARGSSCRWTRCHAAPTASSCGGCCARAQVPSDERGLEATTLRWQFALPRPGGTGRAGPGEGLTRSEH